MFICNQLWLFPPPSNRTPPKNSGTAAMAPTGNGSVAQLLFAACAEGMVFAASSILGASRL